MYAKKKHEKEKEQDFTSGPKKIKKPQYSQHQLLFFDLSFSITEILATF